LSTIVGVALPFFAVLLCGMLAARLRLIDDAGLLGTARMQYQLRQCFVFLDSRVLSKPEVMIGGAAQKFDAEGNLTDDVTGNLIAALLTALVAWTERLRPRAAATEA
jgi:NAD(P)H-dependent FMN reductase